MLMTTLGIAVATCALAGAPAPGHGIYSDITSGVPLTNGNLLVPNPHPYTRTRTTTYTNGGRLWTPYTAEEKILSSIHPGGGGATVGAPLYAGQAGAGGAGGQSGLAVVGAPLDEGDLVIFVRPESEPWPDVAISPYQTIDERTLESIFRRRPWLQRSPERSQNLIHELRTAQRRYLKQQGYVAKVRTHINPLALRRGGAGEKSSQSGGVEPSATIRLTPVKPAPEKELRTSVPNDASVVRVSLPGSETTRPQITVVRQETEPESGAGEQG